MVGLRLGATLAAAELARGGPVDDFVMWDPCATGRAFVREQIALAAFRSDGSAGERSPGEGEIPGSAEAGADGSLEPPGAVFSAATVSELGPIAISGSDQSLASRELVLARKGRGLARAVTERLTLPHVELAEVDGQEALFVDQPVTPLPTLDRIATWLAEPGGPVVQMAVPDRHAVAVHRTDGPCDVRERAVELGPARLFGVLSEPDGPIDPSAPTVIFLNLGLLSHHGPARLWVELARAWAGGGRIRCLRVDLSGMGDSPTRPGRTDLRPFPVDALEDMGDIRRAVTHDDGADLVLVGVCSGADHAIESVLAEPVASLCVVNPALSYQQWGRDWRAPGSDLAPAGSGDPRSWGATGPWLSRVLVRFERYRGLTRWIPNWGWWMVKRWFMSGSPVRTLEHLSQSGVDVLIVASREETRRVYRGEHRRFRALVSSGGVHAETVPHLDHSLFERTGRDRVAELLSGYVAGLGRAADPRVDP